MGNIYNLSWAIGIMMFRTHFAFGLLIGLLFLPHVQHILIFLPVLLVSSLIPDIDTAQSFIGRRAWIFRPMQWIVRHRSFIHSFTFCIAVTLLFVLYIPIIALPFFLGFSTHLFADALTVEGIRPFWPSKTELAGKIRTGGKREAGIFIFVVVLDIALIVNLFLKII